MALRTTCIKNVKFKITKIKTGIVSMYDTFTTAKTETGPHKTIDWAVGWT